MSLNLMHLIAENSAAMNTTEQKKAGAGGRNLAMATIVLSAARYGGDSLGRWQNDGRPQI
jgi:hypothetical protein